jgi:hypothetical protein
VADLQAEKTGSNGDQMTRPSESLLLGPGPLRLLCTLASGARSRPLCSASLPLSPSWTDSSASDAPLCEQREQSLDEVPTGALAVYGPDRWINKANGGVRSAHECRIEFSSFLLDDLIWKDLTDDRKINSENEIVIIISKLNLHVMAQSNCV